MEYFASQDPRSNSFYFDLKFDFGPEKLSGLLRNGSEGSSFDRKVLALCLSLGS